MSLTLIKGQIATNLAGVSGVSRVFSSPPSVSPANADCPAIVLERQDPFLEVQAHSNGDLLFTWKWHILFLLMPAGESVQDEIDVALEPYPARIIAALYADQKLSGKAGWLLDPQPFSVGMLSYLAQNYYGFAVEYNVVERVTTTFG